MDQKNIELLSSHLGEEKAKELIKLTKNYDSYLAKFKEKVNQLLSPVNLQVQTGIAFVQKEKGD